MRSHTVAGRAGSPDAAKRRTWRRTWRRRATRWLGVVAGTLAALAGSRAVADAASDIEAGSATARTMPAPVPAAWADFARRLQLRFQQRLGSDNAAAVRFHQEMSRLVVADRSKPPSVVVKVWVLADGKVERVEMEGAHSGDALRDLSAALVADAVSGVPADMPQPLRLRLSLRPRDPAEPSP